MNVNTQINNQRWEVFGWRGCYTIRTVMRNTSSASNPDGGWEGGDVVAERIRWRDTANRIVRLHNLSLNKSAQKLST